MFDRLGYVQFNADVASADAVFEAAVDMGADNVESDDEVHEVYTTIESFIAVKEALEAKFGACAEAALIWKPHNLTQVDAEKAVALVKLIDTLEDNDDVQNVFGNYDIADDVMEKLAATG